MKKFKSLQGTLLFGIMLISACITSIVVLVSFYMDYDDELANQNKMFLQIEALSVPALARPIWDLDAKGVEAQISALNTIRDIVRVTVLDPNDQVLGSAKKEESLQVDEIREYPISASADMGEGSQKIGLLRVEVTKTFIYERLYKKFWIFFLSQFVKTLLVSSLIFLFIYKTVTKRILALFSYISQNEERAIEKWQLFNPQDEGKKHSDELTQLEDALNRQIKKIVGLTLKNNELIWSQSEEIDRQRQTAIESARLAAVGELSSSIAHEINNPLAIIGLTAKTIEMAVNKKEPAEKILDLLGKIKKMIDRTSRVIAAMKLSVRDASEDPIVPVLIKDLLAEALVLSQSRIVDSGVKLDVVNPIDPHQKIAGREAQVLQILVNMLNNAFDAVTGTKEAWIRLEVFSTSSGLIDFKVTDSGPGIPQELQSKLFTPFFTTKQVGYGVGLGLSISKNNAKANKGELFLDTQSANTAFVLRLPSAQS